MFARLLKLLHELGSIGMLGSVAVCLLLQRLHPQGSTEDYARASASIADIVHYLLMPSFVLVLLSGLLAITATPAFMNAGWVWFKALLGLSVFEASLTLSGNAQRAAQLSAQASSGQQVLEQLAQVTRTETGVLWVLLGISVVNVVVAIWRPRLRLRIST